MPMAKVEVMLSIFMVDGLLYEGNEVMELVWRRSSVFVDGEFA